MQTPKINIPTLIKEQHKKHHQTKKQKVYSMYSQNKFINQDTVPRTLMSTNRTNNGQNVLKKEKKHF